MAKKGKDNEKAGTDVRSIAHAYGMLFREKEALEREMEGLEVQLRGFGSVSEYFLDDDLKVYLQEGSVQSRIQDGVFDELTFEELRRVASVLQGKLKEVRPDLYQKYRIEEGRSKASLRVSSLSKEDRRRLIEG